MWGNSVLTCLQTVSGYSKHTGLTDGVTTLPASVILVHLHQNQEQSKFQEEVTTDQ